MALLSDPARLALSMADLNQVFFNRHLEDDEELILLVHKHWLLGFKFLFWPTVSFIAGWAVLYVFPVKMILYLAVLWGIASLVWLFRNFFDYYLDAWIITDSGVIDVEWHGWFHRQSTRVLYSDIQGVSYEFQGVLSTVLRYGSISVEKISTGSVISMDYVSNPKQVEGIILRNMEGYLHDKNLKDSRHVQELLSSMVAREMQMEEFDEEDEIDDDEEDWEEEDDDE